MTDSLKKIHIAMSSRTIYYIASSKHYNAVEVEVPEGLEDEIYHTDDSFWDIQERLESLYYKAKKAK